MDFPARPDGYPHTLLHLVKEFSWGQRSVRLCDPDGHIIEVGECMEFVVKRLFGNGLSIEEVFRKTLYPVAFVEKCPEEEKRKTAPPSVKREPAVPALHRTAKTVKHYYCSFFHSKIPVFSVRNGLKCIRSMVYYNRI